MQKCRILKYFLGYLKPIADDPDELRADKWLHDAIFARQSKKTHNKLDGISTKCQTPYLKFFMNYQFPEDLKDGFDYLDTSMLKFQKNYFINYPESCNVSFLQFWVEFQIHDDCLKLSF